MVEEKEELLEKLRRVKQTAEKYLADNNFDNYIVKNVVRYNKEIELTQKKSKNNTTHKFHLYVAELENTNPKLDREDILTELEFLEDENGNLYTISDLIQKYEGFENIKDVVDKTKENEEKPEEEQEEELKKDTLEELEEEREKEQEEEQSKDKNKSIKKDEKKKRKPSYVIERINPDKAKMDYWQTIKQACGLPEEVDTLAFSYPVSSEDKVDYANITIYMLDKDGYIIDDLKIDDYFEFDTSTGNNPMQDETVRLEEDENNGKVQTEENRTMIRLKAKKAPDSNSYISLEQKNTLGDNNDINGGSKVKGSINNIEKQLETDHVRVWESESEKTIRANAGEYKGREIYEEIQRHKEHNKEEQYVNDLDADGIKETFECVGEQDWRKLATKWGYYKDGRPDEEKAKSIYEEYKYNNPHLSDVELVQEISDDLYDQTPGGRINR